ncbi:4873_t:CDS:1 [Paraglomus brasilianum]|uniref:4873_t:CDS:1 n=1 Tax=Paraglomus brasilianum TaxID=144538 RepID=A0A9N8Z3Q7_9GLOM|nr:4873_t:CDS:1 [Paraglomus brasilianum]
MTYNSQSIRETISSQFVTSIRSGGQTGVDRAALDAALQFNNIKVTGWCPQGRLAEDGQILPKYPLKETSTKEYTERTELNVRDADATLVLLFSTSDPNQDGTAFTLRKADQLRKPNICILIDEETNVDRVCNWVRENKVKTLNIAGPRESSCPGIYAKAYKFITDFLVHLSLS